MKYRIKRFSDKPTVYFMIGPPGAGKSTWASTNLRDLPVISRDTIREKLGMTEEGVKLLGTPEQERRVTEECERLEKELISSGQSFVLDNTNTSNKHLLPKINELRSKGYKINGVFMETPVETCIERRRGQVPENVIRSMWRGMKTINPKFFNKAIRVR